MAKLAPLDLSIYANFSIQKGEFMDSVDPLENMPSISPRPSTATEIVWNSLPVSLMSH